MFVVNATDILYLVVGIGIGLVIPHGRRYYRSYRRRYYRRY